MSKPIIEVENLSKYFRISANKKPYLSLREEIAKFASSLRSGTKDKGQSYQDFWALKDVSFAVQKGEAVGIIGRNGAGKSTLLKIISQITPPTKGQIAMRGRVASLLEVGTGFHPELTGRENIFLNGAILGMSREEIRKKLDEIVAFAEVEKFLDTPVKRYSSGMYVRLAFAVAAHLEPEILVVDEVLAVGDAQFQKKCLGKMGEVAEGGRTVLFVSHNMAAIQALCTQVVILEQGKTSGVRPVGDAISMYLMAQGNSSQSTFWELKSPSKIGISKVTVVDSQNNEIDHVICGDAFNIRMEFNLKNIGKNLAFAAVFYDENGNSVCACQSNISSTVTDSKELKGIASCRVPRLTLVPGVYRIDVSLDVSGERLDFIENVIQLPVESGDFFGTGRLPEKRWGTLLLDHQWSIL